LQEANQQTANEANRRVEEQRRYEGEIQRIRGEASRQLEELTRRAEELHQHTQEEARQRVEERKVHEEEKEKAKDEENRRIEAIFSRTERIVQEAQEAVAAANASRDKAERESEVKIRKAIEEAMVLEREKGYVGHERQLRGNADLEDEDDVEAVQKLVQAQISTREDVDDDMGLGTRPNEMGYASGGTRVRDFSLIVFFLADPSSKGPADKETSRNRANKDGSF
jgi:hypothetical protein